MLVTLHDRVHGCVTAFEGAGSTVLLFRFVVGEITCERPGEQLHPLTGVCR